MVKIRILVLIFIISIIVFSYELTSNKTTVIGDTIYMSKGVRLISSEYNCITDTAVFLRKDSIIIMPQKLKINSSDTLEINATNGIYYIKDKIFDFYNQKTIINENSIQSDFVKIFIIDSNIVYAGNTNAYLKEKNYTIKCDTLINNYKLNYMYIFNNGILEKGDSNYVNADTFYIDISDSTYYFYHNANILNHNSQIISDSIVVFDKEHIIRSYYRSKIVNDSNELYGDSMYVYMKNDSIDYIEFYCNIEFENNSKNEKNKISCDSVYLNFLDNKLENIQFFYIKNAQLIIKKDTNDTED